MAEALHRAEEAEQRCAEVRAELKVTVNKLESATARIVLLTGLCDTLHTLLWSCVLVPECRLSATHPSWCLLRLGHM